jgi:molybdenum cofactor cytidylyltransferase
MSQDIGVFSQFRHMATPIDASGIGLILLAAGGSRRLGRPKQLLRLGGESLARRAARLALNAGCRPVVAVSGAHAQKVEAEWAGLDLMVAHNAHWREGMGASLRAGMEALSDAGLEQRLDALIVMLVDQPRIGSDVLRRLIEAYRAPTPPPPIVACAFDERLGPPALFDRRLFPALRQAQGDRGARALFDAHRAALVAIPCPQAGFDIDTLEDWENFEQ